MHSASVLGSSVPKKSALKTLAALQTDAKVLSFGLTRMGTSSKTVKVSLGHSDSALF